MIKVQYTYGLEEKPPLVETLLYSLQWLAISLPGVLIIGKVVGTLHFSQPGEQILYLQKIFFVTGLSLLTQILFGHRLPLLIGPAAVLLVGITAARGFSLESIYTAILVNGLILFFLSLSGLFAKLQRLFTTTVVAVVLLLIAFTLTPTVLHLITATGNPASAITHLLFALIFIPVMFLVERLLKGVWKSTLMILAVVSGTLLHILFLGVDNSDMIAAGQRWIAWPLRELTTTLGFDWGVILSFLFCFMALAINDLGSIQSLKELLDLPDIKQRTRRGISLTGLSNCLCGFLGVIGSVNLSISPGVLLSTRCASRVTLLPTAGILMACSFSPAAVAYMSAIPGLIIGCVLFYILANQVAAGLSVATTGKEPFSFQMGLSLGIPVLLGTLLSFLPGAIVAEFPAFFRPIVGNGFVMGVLASLLIEHVLFRINQGSKDGGP